MYVSIIFVQGMLKDKLWLLQIHNQYYTMDYMVSTKLFKI